MITSAGMPILKGVDHERTAADVRGKTLVFRGGLPDAFAADEKNIGNRIFDSDPRDRPPLSAQASKKKRGGRQKKRRDFPARAHTAADHCFVQIRQLSCRSFTIPSSAVRTSYSRDRIPGSSWFRQMPVSK